MKTKMTQQEMHEAWKKRNEEKKNKPTPVLTPEKYEELKAANQSDNKIMADYGFYASKFHAWKKEHNLIGKHNLKTIQKEQGGAAEVKSTIYQAKSQTVTQKVTDGSKEIERLTQINERQLKDNQKLAEENENLHKKLQEPTFPALEEELSKWKSDHTEISKQYQKAIEDCAKLDNHLSEVKAYQEETNAELIILKNQLTNAEKRIQQLKQIESDYILLERDFLNERGEKERLARMLDRLKNTEQINVWLMEQHVAFHAQLDEVTA